MIAVIRVIGKFKKVLTEHQRMRIIQLGILMVIGGFIETCSVSLILPFMDAVMNPERIMSNEYVEDICRVFGIGTVNGFLLLLAFLLAAVYILKNVYLLFEFNIQYRFVYGNMFAMQKRLLEIFIHRPYEDFLTLNSGEVIRIINSDTGSAFNLLVTLLSLFTELIVSSMLLVAIFVMNPIATGFITVLLLILLGIIYSLIKPVLRRAGKNYQRAAAGMTKWLLQSIQGIKELKVMGSEQFFQDNYNYFGQEYIKTNRQNQILNIAPRFFIEGVSMGTMFIVIALLIYSGEELDAVIPLLTTIAMAAIRLLPSVNRISSALSQVAYNESMLDKMIENIKTYTNNKDALDRSPEKLRKVSEFNEELSFSQVTYHYPNTEHNVLDKVSMTIHKGESVGIIGPSGAGKTTVVDIMLGLLRPQDGSVEIDNINIDEDMQGWLKQTGYIPQSIFMLDDTIRSNVAFGIDGDMVSDDDVWSALDKASLSDFVKGLPEQLDTEIGERGMRLSGGQRQRIGIARALFRNPEILIFDEATSALDNATEEEIMDSIHALHGEKTMIIIAHRLTTIESCDHLFEVKDGKIHKIR